MLFRLAMSFSVLMCSLQILAADNLPRFKPYREMFIPLGGGRTISISALELHPESKKWVIAIPGATYEFHDARELVHEPEFAAFLKAGFNIAYMNKTGVFGDNFDRRMFMDSFRADLRLQDSLAALREGIPGADKEFYLVTNSEASYLAPEMALAEPRIKALVMKSGGTRPWLTEELAKMTPIELKKGGKKVARIRSGKVPGHEIWNGYPVSALLSYDQIKTKDALMTLTIPVLAIVAADDSLIDAKGAIEDLADVAKVEGSKLSRAILFRGGHGLFDRDFTVARHTLAFIIAASVGASATIPPGIKTCYFTFDHQLLSYK